MLDRHLDQIVNFSCPFYRRYHNIELPVEGIMRLSLYPCFVRTFYDRETIENFTLIKSHGGKDSISGISKGLFNYWEFCGCPANRNCADVYVCGEVQSCVKKKNSVTGRSYYVTTIDIGSALLDVVSKRRAFWALPKNGEFLAVYGQLTGYLEKWTDSSEN